MLVIYGVNQVDLCREMKVTRSDISQVCSLPRILLRFVAVSNHR